MELAPWVRTRVWRAEDWPATLVGLRDQVMAEGKSARTADRLWDVACATEHCDPDRGRALALFVEAWRAGHPDARLRATTLAMALRAHMTLAVLALGEGDLLAAGTAYLDAGFHQLAVEPLACFVKAGAPREALDDATALLAIARGTKFDPGRAIAENLAAAITLRGSAAVARYVHAARLARASGLPDQVTAVLASATRACPGDATITGLLDEHRFERDDPTELIEHYRTCFEAAADRKDYVARLAAAARELIGRDVQRGLGLRLLRLSLESAYEALLPDVPSHIAMWELLVAQGRASGTVRELLPLLVQALAAPLSEDDALYLTARGLSLTWRDLGDTEAAQPYAATVLDFAPDHPLARALLHEVGAEVVEAPPSSPVMPVAVAAAARPNVYASDTQVKRVPTTSAVKHAIKIANRLSLLKPPPQRKTTLRRDTSPIPSAPPARPVAAPRAPRTVLPVDVVIELPSGAFFSTVLRDISTSGAFVITKRKLDVGDTVALALVVPERSSLRQSRHQVTARIARQSEVGYGLAFVEPSVALVAALRAATE